MNSCFYLFQRRNFELEAFLETLKSVSGTNKMLSITKMIIAKIFILEIFPVSTSIFSKHIFWLFWQLPVKCFSCTYIKWHGKLLPWKHLLMEKEVTSCQYKLAWQKWLCPLFYCHFISNTWTAMQKSNKTSKRRTHQSNKVWHCSDKIIESLKSSN